MSLPLEIPRQIFWDPEGQTESTCAGSRRVMLCVEPEHLDSGMLLLHQKPGQSWVLSKCPAGGPVKDLGYG